MSIPTRSTRRIARRHITVSDLVTALAVGLTGGMWLSWLDLHASTATIDQGPASHAVTVLAFTLPPVLLILPVLSAALRGTATGLAARLRVNASAIRRNGHESPTWAAFSSDCRIPEPPALRSNATRSM